MYKNLINVVILCIIFNFLIFFFIKNFYFNNFFYIQLITLGILISSFFSEIVRNNLVKYWLKFGKLISIILNPIFLTILYLLIITPYSYILKLFKKNIFGYEIDKNVKSYWIDRDENATFENLKDQF